MKTSNFLSPMPVALIVSLLAVAGCERPPVDSVQRGYRGTGMQVVVNPRMLEQSLAINMPPAAQPEAPAVGPKAGDVYQNVQVLGDVSVPQFVRLMTGITAWVAPEQGCAYCHEGENYADDTLYTKKVARVMIAMTQQINQDWATHVAPTGVTCYTCHRGKNVPQYAWSADPGPDRARGMVAQADQNIAAAAVGYSSLPYDPFSTFLEDKTNIRVVSDTALPTGNPSNIKDTEHTYALMMHFANSLGVNCTYCHNSRAFSSWDESPPTKAKGWHGIQMVRQLNTTFIAATAADLPPQRMGPMGDVPKVNCMTCHQAAYKPMYGARMLEQYQNLGRLADEVRNTYIKGG
jgi:photosynthetic reaction center cytochrome c subunit